MGIDASRITAIHANILEDAAAVKKQDRRSFDIAVANILADVIIPLSDYIGDFIKPGGIFISSGILNEKSDAVEQALLRNNYTILERNTMGDWVSFVCQK